ncbi:MAG: DNA methylase, partial [Thermoplasmata archaeon]
RKLGRNSLGIELNASVADKASKLCQKVSGSSSAIIMQGDSLKINLKQVMQSYGIREFNFMLLHPPYHDIIKFSNDDEDLSNARDTDEFLRMFEMAVDNVTPYLQKKRFLALVIGDQYRDGEWVPLGFLSMNVLIRKKFTLKSIIVKNFDRTKGKQKNSGLWRYRAMAGGFYVFKHEYIMIFEKK